MFIIGHLLLTFGNILCTFLLLVLCKPLLVNTRTKTEKQSREKKLNNGIMFIHCNDHFL